jgi:hypothetical protein
MMLFSKPGDSRRVAEEITDEGRCTQRREFALEKWCHDFFYAPVIAFVSIDPKRQFGNQRHTLL